MTDPLFDIKNMLSKEEKQKLKFTAADRESVFQMIRESKNRTVKEKIPLKLAVYTKNKGK